MTTDTGVDVRLNGLVVEGDAWLAAPAERVFDALTTPEWLSAWWGEEDSYTSSNWQIAPVPGSAWRCDIVTRHGVRHGIHGEVLAAERPQRLCLSWQPTWQPELCTEVEFTLQAHEGGTRLRLRHRGFRPDFTGLTTHAAGWPWVLGWLSRWLLTSPPAKGIR
jgi:uncharacterized protein YndB with AHSA1/START domain